MARFSGLQPRKPLTKRAKILLALLSFALPLGLWSAVSYIPFLWHPDIRIVSPGGSENLQPGEHLDKDSFAAVNKDLADQGLTLAQGEPANPVFLPAPHEVARAFYTGFTTPPRRAGDPWLHEALLHSIAVILWGFLISCLFGIPLGILAGTYGLFRGILEPFIEFFRYLPAPAFGALAVAVLGINDEPKIAIIFLGTFFQMVLVIASTAGRFDVTLLESAQTMGVKGVRLLTRVVVPGILPELYRDLRLLLGWAWTYLIVSEVVGTSTGITWFINQQAKYRIYENVFAAIIMIGIIGITTDALLAWIGRRLFPWHRLQTKEAV